MQEAIRQLRFFLKGMWRRRWIGLIASWCVAILGAIAVFLMPSQYESNARIYVDTSSLIGEVLGPMAIAGDVERQVRVIQQTLLSRPNVRQVARVTDMDLEVQTAAEMEALVGSIIRRTQISMDGSGLFLVSFTDEDPERAKDVVQALMNILIERNTGENRTDIQTARSFIENQIAEYEDELREAEQRIAKFRADNVDVLGSSNYAQRLQAARDTLEDAEIAFSDATAKRDQLRAQLEATPRTVSLESTPQIIVGGEQVPSTLARVRQLRAQLDELLTIYTESHPDVISTRRQLDRAIWQLNRERSGEGGLASGAEGTSQVPNPVYEQVQIRLIDAEAEVERTDRFQKRARAELERLQRYAEGAPQLDAELADITREYDILNRSYNELLARREQITISQKVDAETETVQFRVVEPPEVPVTPSAPNRPFFLLAVFVLAIGAGGGTSFARSQIEETFFAPEQIERTFGLAVLGTVTRVMNPHEVARNTLRNFGFTLGAASLLVFFGGLFLALAFFGGDRSVVEVASLAR